MNYLRNQKLIEKLGLRIKELREKRDMSQEDLGSECGMERNTIYRIEKGKVNTSISVIEELAKALGLSISELMEGL